MLVEGEQVLATRLHWPGELQAGSDVEARLVTKLRGARRGLARTADGVEILVDHLPPRITEGEKVTLTITRAPMAEIGRLKRAAGRATPFVGDDGERGGSLPAADGFVLDRDPDVKVTQLPTGRFLDRRWDEVWHAASMASIHFAGGNLIVSVTPAMTVIDVDGDADARELALAAVPAIRRAIRWFDIAGNIGIDFPTLSAKADRRAVDTALAEELSDWPHERTAMNGFGFVQIVARLERPSFVHRFAYDPAGMAARFLMRQGERVEGSGPVLELTANPAVAAKLTDAWLTELTRRTGRTVRVAARDTVAITGGHAQIVER